MRDLGHRGYLIAGWELDHLGREKAVVEGSLLGRSRHVECLLARKVGCSKRRDVLRDAVYILEDMYVGLGSSVGDVARIAHCGRKSC
jgi:hypothetical protein